MISYSHASVYTSKPEAYVLKIHGRDVHDVYIQLGDFITMESWQACLNQDIMKEMTRNPHNNILVSSSIGTTTTASSTTIKQDTSTASIVKDGKEDKDGIEKEDHTFSPQYVSRRRRSKSHPSILSGLDKQNSLFQQKYPLLFSTLSSDSAATSFNIPSSTRKRRKTFNEYYGD